MEFRQIHAPARKENEKRVKDKRSFSVVLLSTHVFSFFLRAGTCVCPVLVPGMTLLVCACGLCDNVYSVCCYFDMFFTASTTTTKTRKTTMIAPLVISFPLPSIFHVLRVLPQEIPEPGLLARSALCRTMQTYLAFSSVEVIRKSATETRRPIPTDTTKE